MAGVSTDEVVVPRSEISLRSVEDSTRWFKILSQNAEGPSTVFGLHVTGVESFPLLLAWPKLQNLHHLELRGIDFRHSRESLIPFFDAQSSSIDELVLEELRFREVDELFALINPFKNLVSLTIHDVEWGKDGLLNEGEAESDSESESEDETHKHTMQPGDCCTIANAGSYPLGANGLDLPMLKHLSLRRCSSTITRHFTRMPSKLRLSRLEISWEDEHLLPLGEMIESCAPSLSELSISGVFHTGRRSGLKMTTTIPHSDSALLTECDYPLSLESSTRLSSLYLNGIHLFLDEPLGPALHHLASTLPRSKDGDHPRSINIGFILEVGQAWESRMDGVDWDAVGMSLTSLKSRLEEGKDNWSATMKVDSSYLSISEEEERRILDFAEKKLKTFSAALQLDNR